MDNGSMEIGRNEAGGGGFSRGHSLRKHCPGQRLAVPGD